MSIIKVDGIGSVLDALAFEAAGVTIIGVKLGLNPGLQGRQLISPVTTQEIARSLTTAKLCIMLDPEIRDPYEAIDPALDLTPDYLQVAQASDASTTFWQDVLSDIGGPIIWDSFSVSHEDEPQTPMVGLDNALSWGASLVQLDLLDDIPNPWRFLQDEAYKVPDELMQIHEIVELTEKYPVLITMEVTREEVFAFRSTFPAAAGVFFRLSPGDITPTLELIKALQGPPMRAR